MPLSPDLDDLFVDCTGKCASFSDSEPSINGCTFHSGTQTATYTLPQPLLFEDLLMEMSVLAPGLHCYLVQTGDPQFLV